MKICDCCLQANRSHVTEVEGQDDGDGSTLKVVLLGSEWNSLAGGISTLNRELEIHLAEDPKLKVNVLVPEKSCKDEEKREVRRYGVTIVDAEELPGYHPLDWLSFPPKDLGIDIVVGHGAKLGRQGQVIRNAPQRNNCKWVQLVHTTSEDLGKFKNYNNPISQGERKNQIEVDLCKRADLVVPVGPRLEEFYSCYLRRYKKDIFTLTPGLFAREFGDLEQASGDNAVFRVLIFGRGDLEDFELKGYNIAAEAFTDQRLKKKPNYQLIFVGAPEGKQDEVAEKLVHCGIAKEQLDVRRFVGSREEMKDIFCQVDLAVMPSKSEGFGLVALEALSAGLPILVGSRSGIAKALENVPNGDKCIVNSDDPAKWAEAIEAVHVKHRMRLKEIKVLQDSYSKMYSWKEQCRALVERMRKMVHVRSGEL